MNTQTKTAVLSLALAMLVVISAIACVFSRHESRMQFTKLQSLISQRDALEVDWGRLQIEQSTWSTHSRVERLARKSMAMRNPTPEEILVVRQ